MLGRTLVLTVIVAVAPAWAQIHLPGGDIEIPVRIPGLDRILKADPALATSFEDAITGVPFLDDFEPVVYAPLVEAPRGSGHSFLLGPGAWRGALESYCLHAGVHGPGKGEGYLLAPLRGPRAEVIGQILRETVAHPELAQEDIQALIWGILARGKISDMPNALRTAAQAVLTPAQIRRLNGGALGRVPDEVMDRAFGQLPPAARQIMQAEAQLRGMLASQVYDYTDLEGVAVLTGEPPPDENAVGVPRHRWSYHPGGYFVRYDPDGYSLTQTDVYVPEPTSVLTDDLGRITAIAALDGSQLELTYSDDPVLQVAGDDAVRGYLIASVRLAAGTGPDATERTLDDAGWVLVGVPSGDGAPADDGPFTGVAERYAGAVEHLAELQRLSVAVRKVGGAPMSEPDARELMPRMLDLASCHQALKQATADAGLEQWTGGPLSLPQRAWALRLAAIGDGLPYAEEDQQAHLHRPAELMLASAYLQPGMLAQAATTAPRRRFRELQPLRPGGDVGQPSDWRQRLGQSNRPTPGGNGKEVLERSKKAIGWISKGKQVVDAVTNPVGTIAGQVGFGIHDQLQAGYFDWLFGTSAEISRQLGGDPPRADFNVLELPAALDTGSASDFGDVPPQRAAALQALRVAMVDLVANLRAGQISLDRLGGALEAGDDRWQQGQSAALTEYKRSSGQAFLRAADCLDALVAELQAEGIREIYISADTYAAYQQRLRTQGFSAQEVEAAHRAGLSDAEIAADLAERIGLDPSEQAGDLLEGGHEAAAAMRELGARWASLPTYDLDEVGSWVSEQP